MRLAAAHSSNSTNCNVNKQEYILALNQKMLRITTTAAPGLLITSVPCSFHFIECRTFLLQTPVSVYYVVHVSDSNCIIITGICSRLDKPFYCVLLGL